MEPKAELTESQSRQLAVDYRYLVLCFGGQLTLTVVNVVSALTLPGPAAEALATLVALGVLGSIAALAYFGYRTAQAMGSNTPALWGIGMLVPCVNTITLLIMSHRATQLCRAAGIPVGLLGPKLPTPTNDRGSGGAA